MAGKRLLAARAAKTRPALETIIITGSASSSERANPMRSSVNMKMMVLIILPFAVAVILRLSGQSMQKTGRARYVRPIKAPASNPAVNAPNSDADPNAMKVSSESPSIPING